MSITFKSNSMVEYCALTLDFPWNWSHDLSEKAIMRRVFRMISIRRVLPLQSHSGMIHARPTEALSRQVYEFPWLLRYLKDFQIRGTPRACCSPLFQNNRQKSFNYIPKSKKKKWNIWTWKGERGGEGISRETQIEIDEFLAKQQEKQWGRSGSGEGQGWGQRQKYFSAQFSISSQAPAMP